MLAKGNFTLTSPAGYFEFDDPTIMSHAKLVRDTVTAAVMGVMQDHDTGIKVKPPKSPALAYRWFRGITNGPAKDTPFRWIPMSAVRP